MSGTAGKTKKKTKTPKGTKCHAAKETEFNQENVMDTQPKPLQIEKTTEAQIVEGHELDTALTIGHENESMASRDASSENNDNESEDNGGNDNNVTEREKEIDD